MNITKSEALIYAEEYSFDHDISHCNPVEKTENCYSCKRYAAHLQIGIDEERFRDGLYSYFSEPQSSCIDKDYKHFIYIGKKK